MSFVVFETIEDIAEAVARRWADLARSHARIACVGGRSPLPIYRALSTAPWKQRVNWMNLELFLADERWVPLDHPDSNWKSVSNALHQTITGIPYATTPSESAQLYEEILSRSFEGDRTARWPQFDFLLLGLGSDGHVASLFPSPPGKIIERSRRGWVVVTESPLHPHPRVTLAWDTILSARETWLIVSGGEKSVALKQLMEGNPKLPASRLMETRGVCTIAIESQKELVHA